MQESGSDPLSLFNFIHNVYKREGSQARSTASGSGPDLAGVLGFESHPSHWHIFDDFFNLNPPDMVKNVHDFSGDLKKMQIQKKISGF